MLPSSQHLKKGRLLIFWILLCSIISAYGQVHRGDIRKGIWKGREMEYLDGQLAIKFNDTIKAQVLSSFLSMLNGTAGSLAPLPYGNLQHQPLTDLLPAGLG